MQALAFLNLGVEEIVLILIIALVFFGADKAPQLARALGKARGDFDRAKGQFTEALRTDDERAWDQQVAFEQERERKVSEMQEPAPDPEHAALVRAAEELGLQTQGLSEDELKAALRARLGGAAAEAEGVAEERRTTRQ